MTETTRITVARGDGIGPEIMDATLRVLDAAGAALAIDEIEVGERLYRAGHSSGIPADAWDTIRRNKVLAEGADHDAAGRRLQEPQRHPAQGAEPVCQRAPVQSRTRRLSPHRIPASTW